VNVHLAGVSVTGVAAYRLHDVTLRVGGGELVALLGDATGSGVLRTIAGWSAPSNGAVYLDHEDMWGVVAGDLSRLGVSYLEPHPSRGTYPAGDVLQAAAYLADPAATPAHRHERASHMLSWLLPSLPPEPAAKDLAYEDAVLLTVARAIVARPRVLLVDRLAPHLSAQGYEAAMTALRLAARLDDLAVLIAEVVTDSEPPPAPLDRFDRVMVTKDGEVAPLDVLAGIGHRR
jgi:branched-chain amino acid transport system ATP-binding protein